MTVCLSELETEAKTHTKLKEEENKNGEMTQTTEIDSQFCAYSHLYTQWSYAYYYCTKYRTVFVLCTNSFSVYVKDSVTMGRKQEIHTLILVSAYIPSMQWCHLLEELQLVCDVNKCDNTSFSDKIQVTQDCQEWWCFDSFCLHIDCTCACAQCKCMSKITQTIWQKKKI